MRYPESIWKETEESITSPKTQGNKRDSRLVNPYDGWESTFGCRIPAKRGHRRVPYYPYVVNGFRG